MKRSGPQGGSMPCDSSAAPALETKRLFLRGHRAEDFEGCARMWADERVTRHITGKPSSGQQTWARMLGYAGHWSLLGYGYWAVEEKSSGSFVGELGFADFKRALSPSLEETPEMGWALSPAVHGMGYAKEAIAAALEWGDANLKSRKTACLINPGNLPSIGLAEKFSFQWAQDTQYLGVPVKLFFRNRGGR